MKIMRKQIVWVVIHCEFMQRGNKPSSGLFIDEMVYHVAGSLGDAERFIRARGVMPYSWWKIERRVVDESNVDADDSPERHFYNHNGKPCKREPQLAAMRAFRKRRD